MRYAETTIHPPFMGLIWKGNFSKSGNYEVRRDRVQFDGLTRGNIEKVATNPKDTELYLGGLGTNAKIMWDRVPPEVEPFLPKTC
jgi:hypothetical protein